MLQDKSFVLLNKSINKFIEPRPFKKFFIFLVAYGGGKEASRYGLPNLTEPIDKNRIYEYDFKLVPCEDGYHLEGHIIAPDGKDIGAV